MFFPTRKALLASLTLAAILLNPLSALAADDDEDESDPKKKKKQTTEQTAEGQSGEVETSTIMVTASRQLADVFELPMTVNVVTEQDMRENPRVDLTAILADIPGVDISYTNGGPGTGRVSIRGEDVARTLLLVDGVRMTNQAMSASVTTFLLADTSNIERIEVIKGPATVLYGSEAIGGVVNIITKKGGTGKPIGLSGRIVGDTSNLGVSTSTSVFGDYNGINYRFAGSWTDSGGVKKPDGTRYQDSSFQMRQYSGQLGYDWGGGNFSLQANRYESKLRSAMDNSDRFEWPLNDRTTVGGTLVWDNVSQYLNKLTITGSTQNAERLWFSPGGDVYSDQDFYSLSVQSDWQFGDHGLIAGLEYNFDDVSSRNQRVMGNTNTYQVTGEQTKISVFIQDEWKFHDDWAATFGLRSSFLESKRTGGSLFASEIAQATSKKIKGTVGSAGLSYTGFQDWALRANWTQGRRDPALSHLMIGSAGMGLQVYLPNPDLKSETSNNYEIGARYRGGNWDLDVALFYNDSKNFFDTASTELGGVTVTQFVNSDKAQTFGAEMNLSYTFEDYGLTPYSNLTWIKRDTTMDGVKHKGRSQYGTPKWKGKTGLKWRSDPTARSWNVFMDGYLDWASKGYKIGAKPRPGYQDAGFNIGVSGGDTVKYNLTVAVHNIFNQDFSNGGLSRNTSSGHGASAGRYYVIGLGFEY